MEKKRIYILVKTYPTISETYAELVCTAGILEDGSWIRLYPVPFRKLDLEQKYPKFSWIEVEATRNTKDFRPESYRPNLETLSVVQETKKKPDWEERRRIIFGNQRVYTNLEELITKARTDDTSLAVFKPARILSFNASKTNPAWDSTKLANLEHVSRQLNIFQTVDEIVEEFRVVPKVPYHFSYKFQDDSGRKSTMKILDWGIGMLYANCLKRARGNKEIAVEKVRQKYYEEFLKHDLHFFLGTTLKYHKVGENPFTIVGVFYPLFPSKQLNLFDFA